MDQEELHAILKHLYASVTPSPSSFSTFHNQESFYQQNNINQIDNEGNDYNNSQNLAFQSETFWPLFQSENNTSRTNDNDNWDLYDFVKSFTFGVDTSPSTKSTINTNIDTNTPIGHIEPYIPQKPIVQREENNILQTNHVDTIEELLHDPFDPFDFPKLKIPHNLHISSTPPLFVPKESQDLSNHTYNHQLLYGENGSGLSMYTSTNAKSIIRSKKRKNQMKMIYQVPFEEKLSTRYWRKYGQKYIKGSPYPRGYYRCSANEGCMARKRVEQKKTDPRLLIITYTGKHNHPPLPFEDPLIDNNSMDKDKNEDNSSSSMHSSSAAATNKPVKMKIVEDESGDTGDEYFYDMAIGDDVFETLAEIVDLSDRES